MQQFMISQVVDFHIEAVLFSQAELSSLKADLDKAQSADVINTATKTVLVVRASIIKFHDKNKSSICTTRIEVSEPTVNENFLITVLPMCFLLTTWWPMYEAIRTDRSFIFCFLLEIIAFPWTITIGLAEIVIYVYSLFTIFPLCIHLFIVITTFCTVHTGGVVHA